MVGVIYEAQVNVGGLKNVLKAVKETKTVQRVIYTSSFFALGSTDGSVASEDQVCMMICSSVCFVVFHFDLVSES